MNRDLQRLDSKIRQLEKNNGKLRRDIKMYEIKVGKLRHELGKTINLTNLGYNKDKNLI